MWDPFKNSKMDVSIADALRGVWATILLWRILSNTFFFLYILSTLEVTISVIICKPLRCVRH